MIHSLAPAGDFAPPAALRAVARSLGGISSLGSSVAVFKALEEALQHRLGVTSTALFSSGTAALTTLLRAAREQLGLKTVVIGGYTCPDIVVAALAANCSVQLTDVNDQTMEPVFDGLVVDRKRSVAVLSNLYGVPDQCLPWVKVFGLVVDDGSQAYLSRTSEGGVGLREGVVGLLSFGQGKTLSGAGGGALVTSATTAAEIVSIVEGARDQFPLSGAWLGPITKSLLSWLLERPSLYWILTSVPGLGLGQVRVAKSVLVSSCTTGAAFVMLAQLSRSTEIAEGCIQVANRWHQALEGFGVVEPFVVRGFSFDGSVVPNRYPILLPSADVRKRVEVRLQRAGLGTNRSYGRALNAFFPNLAAPGDLTGARSVASRLLTLPTHRYVSVSDVERAAVIFKRELGGS